METEVGRRFISRRDWLSFNATGQFDVIIANDVFPNVDQRLVLFIEKFLPATQEIRLSLTYYNELRFYMNSASRCGGSFLHACLGRRSDGTGTAEIYT